MSGTVSHLPRFLQLHGYCLCRRRCIILLFHRIRDKRKLFGEMYGYWALVVPGTTVQRNILSRTPFPGPRIG